MSRRFHSGTITSLKDDEVFVFGSNEAGIHGAGAARFAREKLGAKPGTGHGPTGLCYALPTKDRGIHILPLKAIDEYAQAFIAHARLHSETTFLLTAVGCGLAGYRPTQIAPLFANAPANVVFPPEFCAAFEANP